MNNSARILAFTFGIIFLGSLKIKAVTSSDPFKLVSTNLKKLRVLLKTQVFSGIRWISKINSLNSVTFLSPVLRTAIVPDVSNPRAMPERAFCKQNSDHDCFSTFLKNLPIAISDKFRLSATSTSADARKNIDNVTNNLKIIVSIWSFTKALKAFER